MWILDEMMVPPDVVIEPANAAAGLVVRRDGAAAAPLPLELAEASLLDCFRTPARIVDAVAELGKLRGVDPEDLLEDLFPLFEAWLRRGLLTRASLCVSLAPATAPASFVEAQLEPLARLGPLDTRGKPRCSVSFGAAGIAMAFLHLHRRRGEPAWLELAAGWIRRAWDDRHADDAFALSDPRHGGTDFGRISPYHTLSGVYAVSALVDHARGECRRRDAALADFSQAARQPCEVNDLVLGEAGVVLVAALLLASFHPETSPELLRLGREKAALLERRLRDLPPIAEERAIGYLGIAHGWGGMLYALLAWSRTSGDSVAPDLEERLEQLAGLGEARGRGMRWPRIHHSGERPLYLASWCNGAAGLVHLWALAERIFGGERYAELAERSAWNAWEDGDPAVGQLCCGLAGRAYALASVYRLTGRPVWLERARRLADAAARTLDEPGDLPRHSLYRGHLGTAVLAVDLEDPLAAAMPFFELETGPEER